MGPDAICAGALGLVQSEESIGGGVGGELLVEFVQSMARRLALAGNDENEVIQVAIWFVSVPVVVATARGASSLVRASEELVSFASILLGGIGLSEATVTNCVSE